MDFLDFNAEKLYFDDPVSDEVEALIRAAADHYGESEAEGYLLEAYALAPANLSVLVALYRFYYYQYRLQDTLDVANKTLIVTSKLIGFPTDWKALNLKHVGAGAMKSMSTVRFYLYCLKATGFLNLRLGNHDLGVSMLSKVVSLDEHDRLGAKALLDVVAEAAGNTDASEQALVG